MSEQFKATPSVIAQNFNPAWFASIMGTAVIPLAISFINAPWVKPVSITFLILSLILFVVFLIPWTAKFILAPENVKKDLNHPIASNFYPTMPICLVLFSLNLMKFPTFFFSEETSIRLAYYLWLAGAFGIYLMGFIILIHIFKHQEIELSHANFGWYIPPVSKLIVPIAGFELAAKFPQYTEFTVTLSMISLGVGFFLFLFVGAAVYHRYIYHELPMSKFAPTFFIGIAPTAILSVILFKMMVLFQHHVFFGVDPTAFMTIAKLGIFASWGFSAWWFVMALIVTLYYIKALDLPYALSWWAFTFPSGALCISSGITWKATQFELIHTFYILNVTFLLVVWILVLLRTGKGVISGKVFAPSH